MKQRIQKVYKSLPPHTYEAHPLTNSGEASKPLIIGIIAIVAVIALSLLLLFSDQFVGVGKAVYPGKDGTAGLAYPQVVYENTDFTIQVKAHVGTEMAAGIDFELLLGPDVTCKNFVEDFPADVSSFSCDPATNVVTYVGGKSKAVTGEIDIASITFNGVPTGKYVFQFSKFEVKRADKSLIPFSNDVLEQSLLEVQAPVCGDGVLNKVGEQCDDGNIINEDSCTNNCLKTFCGDGQVQGNNGYGEKEVCDGSDFAGKNCETYGFFSGTLICNTADSLSGPCTVDTSQCVAATCSDETKNGQETDVDCGGLDCPKCSDTKMCLINSDCLGNTCINGVCTTPSGDVVPFCGDGIVNQVTEQCDDGNAEDNDACSNSCVAAPTCNDNVKNGKETDVDCGGTECPQCADTKMCSTNDDCLSSNCVGGACKAIVQEKVCDSDQYVCEGANAYKQCKSDASGYNTPVSCASGETCSDGICSAAPPPQQPLSYSVQGIKITLTDVAPANAVFATEVKATEAFSNEITIYTTLYDSAGKVLALKLEKVAGLAKDQVYAAKMNYPEANVQKKSVIVYDVKQNPTVFGSMEVDTS